jgi:hypothetical protein
MEAVFWPEFFSDFFRWLSASFLFFSARNAHKSPEKIQKISGWNIASMFHHFHEA